MSEAPATPATWMRHRVVIVTALMAVLLYLDRFCLSFAEVFIQEDLGLSAEQISYLFGAFFLVYALFQVPSGWLTDRFGPRSMLTIYILGWSACTGLFGLAGSFLVLLALRAGVGLMQAGAYPTAACVISRWVPLTRRGFASSVVAVGGRMGLAAAPLLTAFVIVRLVPPAAGSLLTPQDVLQTQVERWLSLENEQQDEGEHEPTAAEQQALQVRRRLLQPSGPLAELQQGESPSRQSIAEALNQIVNRPAPLFDPAEFPEIKVAKEAKRLLAKQQQSVELSAAQRQRVQRLLLEAVFPNTIRKVYGSGWRRVMIYYGLAGIVVAALYWWTVRDRPAAHPRCNAQERKLIAAASGKPPPKAGESSRPLGAAPLRGLLRSGSMWMVCVGQFFTNVGWVFIATWMPRYLDKVHLVPVEQRGILVMIPPLIGWLGMLSGGRLTDWLTGLVGLRWGRALPMSLSRFMAAAAYLYCAMGDVSAWTAVAAFSVVAFSTDLGTGSVWAFNQDVGGRHVASVLGWGNMWGNLGATVAPTLVIAMVGESGNWQLAFWVSAAAFVAAGLACLAVDARIEIEGSR